MQYKNPTKSGYKSYNSYEDEEQGAPAKRLYSPKYNLAGSPSYAPTETYSPRGTSSQLTTGSPRHWKSYLAPELARVSSRERENHMEVDADSQPQSAANRLKGYNSAYNLKQYENGNMSGVQEERNGSYGQSPSNRKEQYSRRKEQIMNRIKLLQERANLDDDRPQSPTPQQQSHMRLNNSQQEDLHARVFALEQRVQNMTAEYDLKLRRELEAMEKRLRAEFGRAPTK